MKIRVTLKDPDSMHDCVTDAVQKDTKAMLNVVSEAERAAIATSRSCAFQGKISSRWMPYGEYLTVEFDTETWRAVVIPAKEFK